MKILQTDLEGVLIVETTVFSDDRGFFMETYHKKKYHELGISVEFVQDNLSFSVKGTLRGLHYQHPHGQSKLVQVIAGHVYDVIVDVRNGSKNFGQWVGAHLSDENKRQVYIPQGFAHGFYVVSNTVLFLYKFSDLYAPECERGVLWSDPDVGIDWPASNPVLSDKDSKYPRLRDVPLERLPGYKNGCRV
jgi:dTDP-4-dehydrorhamnose 3,5-epimerase